MHEFVAAKEMARALGMRFSIRLNFLEDYSPVRTGADCALPNIISRKEYWQTKKRAYCFPCPQLWCSPQVNWDGKLLGCCANIRGDFGNVFAQGLRECLAGERYSYAKQMLLGRARPREDIPCVKCIVFRGIPYG